jgi:alpha-L-rhamnosidase
MAHIVDLKCEHVHTALGVESSAPRLSWRMESQRRGAHQTAWRVCVASREDLLAACAPDLWDSGRIDSEQSVLVPYAGTRLRARQRCWWQVHAWDDASAALVSEPSWWEMGLLHSRDWKAKWIALRTPESHDGVDQSPLFRTTFTLQKQVRSARAYVCGLGFHELRLNGNKVGDAVLDPPFTKYDTRVLYVVHDITEHLAEGVNAVGLMLGKGWYASKSRDAWKLGEAPWCDECKAIVQIELTFADGTRRTIVSDTEWRGTTGPVTWDHLRMGETYDASLEREGWDTPGYDDAAWECVKLARPPGGVLHARLMPPCRVKNTLQPVSEKEVRPGVRVYDIGLNIAGWARIELRGAAGAEVSLTYAEKLGDDGDIDQSNISGLVKGDRFQNDRYILKGNGAEAYEPRFTYHGFQYARVEVLPGKDATVNTLRGQVVHTDLERIGEFTCSNGLLNRIQSAALASTLGNYHGMPTDCPHREKNGWTGDAHLSAEQVLYNFEPVAAYAKWLDDFADCQRPSGALPGIVPTGGWGYNWGAGPAWDSAYILIPWYLYLYRGDAGILRRHYDGMKRYLGFLDAIADHGIVEFGLGDWCPPTPGASSHKAPAELTNTAYYHADACIVARIAALLGKAADARRYTALARRIKKAARAKFYDRKAGRVAGHSETSLACFLYQGLCEPGEVGLFARMLVDEVAACDYHIDCGILGAKYVMQVLSDTGHADIAYRIATQRDYPSWGLWIERGATTLWESWDGNASRNHHMYSDISAWFYKALAGIRVDDAQPGFKHFVIKPAVVADLAHATGETRSPYGIVRSAWRHEGGRLTLETTIPPGSSATVYIPTADASAVRESGRPLHAAEGVHMTGAQDGYAVCEVTAGEYSFEAVISDQ